jgi:regulator of sigma E protease
MDILIKALQLLLSLAILVTVHEFGHFIPARLFKTKVEKFYLFFNPWFSILRFRKVNGVKKYAWFTKKSPESWDDGSEKTEWGIGWVPLGGYVKIAGMIDESMDKEQMKQPAKPYEFRSKKAWQRLIIMIGGVVVNLCVGIILYISIVFVWGGSEINTSKLNYGMSVHPYLEKYGLKSGDIITKIDGKTIKTIDDLNKGVLLRDKTKITFTREGKEITKALPENIDQQLFQKGAMVPFGLRVKIGKVKEVLEKSEAKAAGLKINDQVIGVNGDAIVYFDELQKGLFTNAGKKVDLLILRGADTMEIHPKVSAEGIIGFSSNNLFTSDTLALVKKNYGLLESIVVGTDYGFNLLKDYVTQFKFVFTKKGATSVGGFASIGNMFPPMWDWRIFWMNTAFISIALAFMNILPIPALDGGHVVFLLYEIITGKEAPQKILEYAQYVGIFLLLSLMIYANGNDLIRIFLK